MQPSKQMKQNNEEIMQVETTSADTARFTPPGKRVAWLVKPSERLYPHETGDWVPVETAVRRARGHVVWAQTWFFARQKGAAALLLEPEHINVELLPENPGQEQTKPTSEVAHECTRKQHPQHIEKGPNDSRPNRQGVNEKRAARRK